MTSLVFDIETDDLNATRIWCLVAQDAHTKRVFKYDPDHIEEGIALLQKADKLIGHNIIGFDVPVIKKLYGIDLSDHCALVDTLVLSRLFHPTREGGHSLDSWGFRLKYPKIEFDDYIRYTPEMLEYCEGDVLLNTRLYWHLNNVESKGFSRQAIQTEYEVHEIINQQMKNGFKLDVEYSTKFLAELEATALEAEEEVHKTFLPKKEITTYEPRYTKAGKLAKTATCVETGAGVRLTDEEYKAFSENKPVKRTKIIPFNLNSPKQVGEYLMDFGWKPTVFTEKGKPSPENPRGNPKTDEKTLAAVRGIPEVRIIARYISIMQRAGFVRSWLECYDEETERVHCYINPLGAITHRMTHSSPNLGQVPRRADKLYASECRKCWVAEPDKVLVGVDASGLELRMLAHYMGDKEYILHVTEGDVHEYNRELAGLESRDQAKTFIYAFLYGAAGERLGNIVKGTKQDGNRLKNKFLDSLPALRALRIRVEKQAKSGYVRGIDGRRIKVRSLHAALNSVLQSAGAIVMKMALVIFNSKLRESGIEAKFVMNVHDEFQVECNEEDAETVGELGVESIIEAGELLDLNCPLDGEYKIGINWSETH